MLLAMRIYGVLTAPTGEPAPLAPAVVVEPPVVPVMVMELPVPLPVVEPAAHTVRLPAVFTLARFT